MEGEGFEPSKAKPADLQSAPVDRLGTPPKLLGAGSRSRTHDLLITSQLLYQLSYAGLSAGYSMVLTDRLQQKNTGPLGK